MDARLVPEAESARAFIRRKRDALFMMPLIAYKKLPCSHPAWRVDAQFATGWRIIGVVSRRAQRAWNALPHHTCRPAYMQKYREDVFGPHAFSGKHEATKALVMAARWSG